MTFGEYLIMKELSEKPETISEGAEPAEIRKAVRKIEKELKGSYIDRLYSKFPKIQYADVEEAFDEAMKEVKKGKPTSEAAAKKAIRRKMEKILSQTNARKKVAGKSLSCVGAVKAAVGTGGTVADLIKKAAKILTSQELKVISLCSEGKPVRKIAEEIGTSFPTAWRVLNSALDKIRVSHGMRPRHLDRRKS
jgi:DNA-binding NarL/FixJ family response regulator